MRRLRCVGKARRGMKSTANRQAVVGDGVVPSKSIVRGTEVRYAERFGYRFLLSCALCIPGVLGVARGMPLPVQCAGSKIISYAISPNGSALAEIVDACGGHGTSSQIIVRRLWDSHGVERVEYSGHALSQIVWMNNRRLLFVRNGVESLVEELDVASRSQEVVLKSRHAISIRGWDARHRRLMISYQRVWRWGRRVSVRVRDSMSTLQFIEPWWARVPHTVVRMYRLRRKLRAGQTRIHLSMRRFVSSPVLAWRSGTPIAVVPSVASFRTRLFNIMTGRRIDPALPLYNLGALAVSESGRLAVASTRLWKSRPHPIAGWDGSRAVYIVRRDGGVRKVAALSAGQYLIAVTGLWWVNHDVLIAQVMGSRGVSGPDRWWLEEVNWRTDRVVRRYEWPGGDLGGYGEGCKFDAERTLAICVAQTLTEPPVLVAVDLRDGAMRSLARIDPEQRALKFGFRAVRIRNRFGDVSTAFLALPKGGRERTVPLVVMAYGFTEAYSRDAQWITSYPIARLVHAGIGVCLVNWAHIPGLRSRGFPSERRVMDGAISTLESALPAVRAEGVRVSRAMIMGWSFGGLFAAHVIEVDPAYVAAQIGDPANWNSTEFSLGNSLWRTVSRWGFGGPPVRHFIMNYVDMDPAGSGLPPHGPVLVEFVSRNPAAGQLLEEWRAAGAELESFVYRHSFHWLNVPAEARISRLRNFYWAKLNLLGPQSVTSAQLRSVGLSVPAKGWWTARALAEVAKRSVAECRHCTTSVPRLPRLRRKVMQRVSLH